MKGPPRPHNRISLERLQQKPTLAGATDINAKLASKAELLDFLGHNVERYLFGDLQRLRNLRVIPAPLGGGVGFPVLQTAFSGIELLGGLTSPAEFSTKPNKGREYFRRYWTEFMYPGQPNSDKIAEAVYTLMRNGVAHSFIPKGRIHVWLGQPDMHLRCDTDLGVHIDCFQLSLDLESSYWRAVRPELARQESALSSLMLMRLPEMLAAYDEQAASVSVREIFPMVDRYRYGATGPSGSPGTLPPEGPTGPVG